MNTTTAAESITEAVVYWRKGDKAMLMIFSLHVWLGGDRICWRWTRFWFTLRWQCFPSVRLHLLLLNDFKETQYFTFIFVFVHLTVQLFPLLFPVPWGICICLLNSRLPDKYVALPCDGSPLSSTTLAGVMALADFPMLCDGNIFNNETLREAHGGICRASHKSSKFLCGPGTATGLKKTKRKSKSIIISVMNPCQWAQDHPPFFSAGILGKVFFPFENCTLLD